MPDRVLVEILVAAPIETVWKALREPAEYCRWFGWNYPNLAQDIEMMFFQNTQFDEATHTIRDKGDSPDRFALEAQGEQTIVRVIRSAPATDETWQGIYSDVQEGWITFFQQLKFMLERHPGADRRTVYLNGRAKSEGTPLPAQALGLDPLAVVRVGERYTIETRTGESLEGTVWYREAYQLGLTVDAYGDGLLIFNARPRTAKSHHGGGRIVVTTYGLDDAAFDEVQDRWKTWWAGTYEVIEMQT
jgi:hypothetical protein